MEFKELNMAKPDLNPFQCIKEELDIKKECIDNQEVKLGEVLNSTQVDSTQNKHLENDLHSSVNVKEEPIGMKINESSTGAINPVFLKCMYDEDTAEKKLTIKEEPLDERDMEIDNLGTTQSQWKQASLEDGVKPKVKIGDDHEASSSNDGSNTTVQDKVNESKNPHPVLTQPVKRKKSAKVSNHQDKLISLACEHLQKPENEFLTVAKAWANDLSKMDPKQLLLVKKEINDIIFEGLCGNLHRQSVQIHPIPQETRCWTPSSDTSEYAPSPYGYYSNTPISGTRGHHSDYGDGVPYQYPSMAARNDIPMSQSSVQDNSGNSVDGTLDVGKYVSSFNPNA